MYRLLATLGAVALGAVAAPAVHASPILPDQVVQTLTDQELAYMKKGGKGWKGWKGKKAKWRGPPPWAPAYGYRRKRGW